MPKTDALDAFLDGHEPIPSGASLAMGTTISNWRIVAFLGHGGSAEVYRAVHVSLPLQIAIKVLVRTDGSRLERFRREADMLSALKCRALPHLYGAGEMDGKPYMAMELLEPYELPHGDKAVASFLIAVAEKVKLLHDRGIVHRDLKPQNIMRREDGSLVIIDLGLAKRMADSRRLPQANTLSVVDGKQVGLGTPQYAAPEQFSGGEITPAADIHALGKLADECFGGNPPRAWRRIIERATSSITERRYPSVDAFVSAIRRRNILRTAAFCVSAIMLLGAIAASIAAWLALGGGESIKWRMLCERGKIVDVEKVYEPYVSPKSGRKGYRILHITNVVEGVVLNLRQRTFSFKEPIALAPGEYSIVGPGRLDAAISGPSNAVVRIKGCTLNNMTTLSYPRNGVGYVLEGGAYLNFANLDENFRTRKFIRYASGTLSGDDEAVAFRGPLTREELERKRRADRVREWREEVERANREDSRSIPAVY